MSRAGLVKAVLPVLFVVGSLWGCGAAPPPDTDTTQETTPPPNTTGTPSATSHEVWIYTTSDKFLVNDFRIDLPKMRNIYFLYGFYPDQWDRLQQVPFSTIREFAIKDPVDTATFDRIYKGREDFQLNSQEIFRVVVTSSTGDTFDYIAIIPKFRGFKDGQRWEMSMAGNPYRIDRIVLSS